MNAPTPDEVNALIAELKGYDWSAPCKNAHAMLTALRDENARLKEDGALLDALEASIKVEPVLLHNCKDSSEWPLIPLGIGLTPWKPRTLRQALRDCVLLPPLSAAEQQARADEEALEAVWLSRDDRNDAGGYTNFCKGFRAALAHARKANK